MRLRRPATVYEQDGLFVPKQIELDEVDWRFKELCKKNSAIYDGRILHVLGVHRNGYGGANIHAMECAYRFYAVQTSEFDIGIRPLGVKGITTCDGSYLWGKRSERVYQYQHSWEFVPAGCVEPSQKPDDVLIQELDEEAGMRPIGNPIQIGIEYDKIARTWEIIYRITIDSQEVQCNEEYSEVKWFHRDELPSGRSSISNLMLKYV